MNEMYHLPRVNFLDDDICFGVYIVNLSMAQSQSGIYLRLSTSLIYQLSALVLFKIIQMSA
jgi:hypothetical protein